MHIDLTGRTILVSGGSRVPVSYFGGRPSLRATAPRGTRGTWRARPS
jgi:hypothetical protein